MNEDKSLFAEMLGMKGRYAAEPEEQALRPENDHLDSETSDLEAQDSETFDELDVQREVVSAMARDNAELEERRIVLEDEKTALAESKAALEAERQTLAEKVSKAESDRLELESRISAYEKEIAELKLDLQEVRGLNQELERKLARMGRTVFAVKRAAAEAARIEIGGRRW